MPIDHVGIMGTVADLWTLVEQLGPRSLRGEIDLGRKEIAIGGFLATASIWKMSVLFQHNWTSGDRPAARCPQAQAEPSILLFSVLARSHVQAPAGRAPAKRILISLWT